MKTLFVCLILLLLSILYVYALPQIDESSITDEKKFLVDNSQCISQARTGGNASGADYAQGAVIGAGIGVGSGVAFGAMTGGDIGREPPLGQSLEVLAVEAEASIERLNLIIRFILNE